MWGAELLRKGLRWEVENSRRVLFWKDAWLDQTHLLERLQGYVEEDDLKLKVVHYWVDGMD